MCLLCLLYMYMHYIKVYDSPRTSLYIRESVLSFLSQASQTLKRYINKIIYGYLTARTGSGLRSLKSILLVTHGSSLTRIACMYKNCSVHTCRWMTDAISSFLFVAFSLYRPINHTFAIAGCSLASILKSATLAVI